MKKFSISNTLYNLLICMVIAYVGSLLFSPSTALIVSGILFLCGFVPRPQVKGAFNNEVIRTMFTSELQKNLYPDNEFYKNSKVDAGIAIESTTIEIPQAGLPPKVIMNPQVRPIPLRIRKDDKLSYGADLFETEPDLVTDINQALVTYDKRGGVLEDHINTLNTRIADEIGIRWFPTKAANILRSSGTGNTGTKRTGMTGTRKELTYQDFIDLCTLMDRMNVPDDGQRCVLISADQVGEIKKIAEFRDYDKTGIVGQLSSGAIGRIQNMNVYKRSTAPMADASGVVKPYGAAIAATDNQAILAWHPAFVRRAEGVAMVYLEPQARPGMGGPTMNAAVRGGGTPSRKDEVGVAALIQQS